MSTDTKIEWATKTWSPLLGCRKVSAGCDNCYAIRTVNRLAHNPNLKVGPLYVGLTERIDDGLDWTGKIRTIPDRLNDPMTWRKPERIFVNSQSDLFHADVPTEFIAEIFAVMALSARHTFQVLTKRPARMRSLLSSDDFVNTVGKAAERMWSSPGWHHAVDTQWPGWPLPNLWMGVSVEDQHWADIRVPALLETPAAVRWISAEPLLGPIDLIGVDHSGHDREPDGTGGYMCSQCSTEDEAVQWLIPEKHIPLDWAVVGCESGPGARPMDLDWAQRIVTQCQAAGTPVLVKQLPTGPRGKATQDVDTFPASLRVREYPTVTA